MTATLAPPRSIRARRIEFAYPDGTLPKHFVGGDLVMSHVVAVLSSLFPEGEDFFVRSVRNYRDRITDPELKRQVAGFIGQEAIHSREHESFNERLQAMGYPTRTMDRSTKALLAFVARTLPRRGQLAVTAALEHYTATLATVLLRDEAAREMLPVDEVRSMLEWHALEECEHKAVAYDVYQQVSGNHAIRSGIMHATTVVFLAVIVVGTTFSMLHDRASANPVRVVRSLARLRHSPFLTRQVLRDLHDYHRRDFHPDDHDTEALLDEWRTTLFGTEGVLAARLPAA